jgi:hypothetical protein
MYLLCPPAGRLQHLDFGIMPLPREVVASRSGRRIGYGLGIVQPAVVDGESIAV